MNWWRKWIGGGRLSSRTTLKQRKLRAKDSREDLVDYLLESAAIAENEGDADTMRSLSYKFIRLELYERAWELRVRSAALKQPSPIPEWEGDDLSGRSILIRYFAPKHRIGEELRFARFIAPVARASRRCIVLSDPRLVALLGRSFSGIEVHPRGAAADAAALDAVDVAAYYETIALRFARNAEEMRGAFVPLVPDPGLVASIRQRYRSRTGGPLIGISWGSTNQNKVLPPIESWAPLLGWSSATFVSLQYGDIKHDLDVFGQFAEGRLISDPKIDQLVDLDGFAAQIAALDAIVSISNTTIDMAGMLGVPTLHIRDDKGSAIWPASGPTPWYPRMTFIYKQQRPWPDLFAEVRSHLEQRLPNVEL